MYLVTFHHCLAVIHVGIYVVYLFTIYNSVCLFSKSLFVSCGSSVFYVEKNRFRKSLILHLVSLSLSPHQSFFNSICTSSLFLFLFSSCSSTIWSWLCVFQVNGKDLSCLSGDPTLDIRDPVLSNILRRGARRRAGLAGAPGGLVPVTMGMADCVDSCTQTDISFQHMLTLGKSSQHPCGAPPPPDPPPSPPLPPLLEPYLLNELWVRVV